MKEFSFYTRHSSLERIKKNEFFDLIIIGGGINGAGVARDAVSRGLKVALFEAQDFSEGTSSRSSKLIHGGIRYLENFEFKLVFEALTERARLFSIAPHLTHPLRFVLPVYKESRVGFWKMGLGVFLYDLLSKFKAPEGYERWNSDQAKHQICGLKTDGLLGAYVYSDGYVDDDRMVLETLLSAHKIGDLSALSYCKVLKGIQNSKKGQQEKIQGVRIQDVLTGLEYDVRAQHIVSTVGPWTDWTAESLVCTKWENLLRPTKGIHLTFERSRIPLTRAVVMAVDKEKRIVFAIPRQEMVVIGTTDTDFQGNPGCVHSSKEDVLYLLKIVNEYFPGLELTPKDIVASYSGVRPLVRDQAATEGKTSREHTIFHHPKGVSFVAGGKYTTYRKMAEEIVESVLPFLSKETNIRIKKSKTLEPLNPLVTEQSYYESLREIDQIKVPGFTPEELKFFVERHGSEWREIFNRYQREIMTLPTDIPLVWLLEAFHAIHSLMCFTLKDFYFRRVPLVLSQKNHGLELLEGLQLVFQKALNLTDVEIKDQIEDLHRSLSLELEWKTQIVGDEVIK